MCITFLYHELDGGDKGPSLASMDFSAAGKTIKGSASGKGHGFRGRYRLIVASNRDEYLDRATAPIHFWKDANQNLLAGRDLVAGGTWLGVSRSGKFATVTNIPSTWDCVLANVAEKGWTGFTVLASKATAVTAAAAAAVAAAAAAALVPDSSTSRRPEHDHADGSHGPSDGSGWAAAAAAASLRLVGSSSSSGPSLGLLCALFAAAGIATAASVGLAAVAASAKARKSRGGLVADFLKGDEDAATYCLRLSKERRRYAGFNLVLVDSSGAWLLSNRDEAGVTRLPHGLYGVGNATLDKPEAKMVHGKSCVLQILLRMAADPTLTEDALVDLLMNVLGDETPQPARGAAAERTDPLASVCVPATTEVGMHWLDSIKLGYVGLKLMLPRKKYATRSSTVVLVDAAGRMKVVERNLGGDKSDGGWTKAGKNGDAREVDVAAAAEAMHIRNAGRNTFEFCDV